MKFKRNNIQFWIGIICIFLSLLSGIFGSYNLYLNDLSSFVEKSVDTYSSINHSDISEGESNIIMSNIVSYIDLGVLSIKASVYNFILMNFIIFLFGLNFIFQSLKK